MVVAADRLAHIVHGVRHAGAAGILDADAQADDGLVGIFDDLGDALGGGVGQGHDLEGHG
ncbi:hypothetical protein D3C71_2242460 [compost metagenome]